VPCCAASGCLCGGNAPTHVELAVGPAQSAAQLQMGGWSCRPNAWTVVRFCDSSPIELRSFPPQGANMPTGANMPACAGLEDLAQTLPCSTDLPPCPIPTRPPQRSSSAPTPLGWTNTPTVKTASPTDVPTLYEAASRVTLYPTNMLSDPPTDPDATYAPSTAQPTPNPTAQPTPSPSYDPTTDPTPQPSATPTEVPTEVLKHPSTIIGITSGAAVLGVLLLSVLGCWCV
jgi:hypothetical protein